MYAEMITRLPSYIQPLSNFEALKVKLLPVSTSFSHNMAKEKGGSAYLLLKITSLMQSNV